MEINGEVKATPLAMTVGSTLFHASEGTILSKAQCTWLRKAQTKFLRALVRNPLWEANEADSLAEARKAKALLTDSNCLVRRAATRRWKWWGRAWRGTEGLAVEMSLKHRRKAWKA